MFLYKQVLADASPADPLGRFSAERSKRPPRVPTVLSGAETARLIDAMPPGDSRQLMARLPYGAGLRAGECCGLRVRDSDFDRGRIMVRGGKGDKDRLVMLPATLVGGLAGQVRRVRHRHGQDVASGGGYAGPGRRTFGHPRRRIVPPGPARVARRSMAAPFVGV